MHEGANLPPPPSVTSGSMIWLGIFLIVWGAATLLTAALKPDLLWNNAKIQGFVKVFKETGTTVVLGLIGLAAVAGGIAIVMNV